MHCKKAPTDKLHLLIHVHPSSSTASYPQFHKFEAVRPIWVGPIFIESTSRELTNQESTNRKHIWSLQCIEGLLYLLLFGYKLPSHCMSLRAAKQTPVYSPFILVYKVRRGNLEQNLIFPSGCKEDCTELLLVAKVYLWSVTSNRKLGSSLYLLGEWDPNREAYENLWVG